MDLRGSATDEILATIDAPVVILNRQGEIVRFYQACEKLTGFTVGEAIGRRPWDFLVPDEEIDAVRAVFEGINGKGLPARHTHHWKTKSGGRRLIEWSSRKLKNVRGEAVYVLATGVDITDTPRALDDGRALLRSIIDACPVAVITIDEGGSILHFSRKAEKTFGYSESEARGQNIHILMAPAERAHHDAGMRRYLSTGETQILGRSRVVNAMRRNGEEFPAVVQVGEFYDEKRIFVGFMDDISEKTAIERRLAETKLELQHVGRVAAMGAMAAAIAHELNQPLTAAASLIGAAVLMLGERDSRDRRQEAVAHLNDAVGEILRASEIIRQMRDFARKRKLEKSLHDMNKVVEEANTIALIGAEEYGIKVTTHYGRDVGQARIDRIKIQQVMTNLIRNAIDAMRDSPERRLTISTRRSNGLIEIRVDDTGCGIPAHIRPRLFEPFFTSKPEGTGIGLAISKLIVDEHHGELFAEDKNESGSIFVLKVPAVDHGKRDGIE